MRKCRCLALLALSLATALTAQAQPAAPAEPDQKPPVAVTPLPEGWQVQAAPKGTLQFASYPDLVASFQLLAEPRGDFSDDIDLLAWAKLVKESVAKSSTLANRTETELKKGQLAGRPVVEYEVIGESSGRKLRFRMIMLQVGDWFCEMACWTTPSRWDASQPKFEELVKNLK